MGKEETWSKVTSKFQNLWKKPSAAGLRSCCGKQGSALSLGPVLAALHAVLSGLPDGLSALQRESCMFLCFWGDAEFLSALCSPCPVFPHLRREAAKKNDSPNSKSQELCLLFSLNICVALEIANIMKSKTKVIHRHR